MNRGLRSDITSKCRRFFPEQPPCHQRAHAAHDNAAERQPERGDDGERGKRACQVRSPGIGFVFDHGSVQRPTAAATAATHTGDTTSAPMPQGLGANPPWYTPMVLHLFRALVYCGKEKGGESGDRPVDAMALALFFFHPGFCREVALQCVTIPFLRRRR